MAKYAPLGEFLQKQSGDSVPLTFSDIERITRAKLPASARYRAWWSNNSFNSVMTKVWLEAGFETSEVDMSARKLVFRRIRKGHPSRSKGDHEPGRHPLFGLSKGMLRINPGTDVTKPADPHWGET